MAKLWRAKELNAMVRRLQPWIIINNRSGQPEDLDTPEQVVRASRPGRVWESCMTMGDSCSWGYVAHNPNMKPAAQLIQNLVTAAAGEGNYLLNIGPRADGSVRAEERQRLAEIGRFLRVNGEAVYNSERCPFGGGMLGLTTAQGSTAYLHIFRWPSNSEAGIAGVANRVLSARLLGSSCRRSLRRANDGRVIISGLPRTPPNPHDNVIALRLDGRPRAIEGCFGRPLQE